MTTDPTTATSPRLTELLRMRRFLDTEIATERQRLAHTPELATVEAAADLYGVTVDDIRGDDRRDHVVRARHLACWMLREHGLALTKIGALIGRDHTTALYGIRAVDHDPARRALGVQLMRQEGEVA